MRHKIFYIVVLLLIFCTKSATSQPDERLIFSPYPETGAWFEPGNSGSGFFIEVQGGVVAGAYFGYENDGGNAWLLFNGEITYPVGSGGSPYELIEVPLTQSMDGECIINCSDPSSNEDRVVEEVATLQLQFLSQTEATFSIDGGPMRTIRPQTYGNQAVAVFPGLPDVLLPNMTGNWLFRVVLGSGNTMENQFPQQAVAVRIGQQSIGVEDGELIVRYPITRSTASIDDFFTDPVQVLIAASPEEEEIGEYRCSESDNSVRCEIDVCEFFSPDICGPLPFSASMNEFIVESQNDHRFVAANNLVGNPPSGFIFVQGFRVDYD